MPFTIILLFLLINAILVHAQHTVTRVTRHTRVSTPAWNEEVANGASLAPAIDLPSTNLDYSFVRGRPYNVSFDARSFLIDGRRLLMLAGSHHYPRSQPEQWPMLFKQMKDSGLNTLQMIIFWSYHEKEKGTLDFSSENRNVTAFMQAAADAGLFIAVRLGPYICAEFAYGGLPFWLRRNKKMVYRSMDPDFLREAERWLDIEAKLIEPFLARNGGPIVVFQLENEYGLIESAHSDGHEYVQWLVDKGKRMNLGIPMNMCAQQDAGQEVLSTFNAFYADDWLSTQRKLWPGQPAMWTENWLGWYQQWSDPRPTRPVEDIAFATTCFFAMGGFYGAYYTFFGGSMFSEFTGYPDLKTDYDFDSVVDVYGTPHPRKYPHIQRLNAVINHYAATLLAQLTPVVDQSMGENLYLDVYNSTTGGVAFLTNGRQGRNSFTTMTFNGTSYFVSAWSTLVIDLDSKTLVFNTSDVQELTADTAFYEPVIVRASDASSRLSWLAQPIPLSGNGCHEAMRPLEQLDVSEFQSDYLWYIVNITLNPAQAAAKALTLSVSNAKQYQLYFINSEFVGSSQHVDALRNVSLTWKATLSPNKPYSLSIVNSLNGVENFGANIERFNYGLLGDLLLDGMNLTDGTHTFQHQVGLSGEWLKFPSGSDDLNWHDSASEPAPSTLTWWRWQFPSLAPHPPTHHALEPTWQIDVGAFGKGIMFINEHRLGRFNNVSITATSCSPCDPTILYNQGTCLTDCGDIAQRFLHVPRSWLKPVGQLNVVVAIVELGCEPTSLVLQQRD